MTEQLAPALRELNQLAAAPNTMRMIRDTARGSTHRVPKVVVRIGTKKSAITTEAISLLTQDWSSRLASDGIQAEVHLEVYQSTDLRLDVVDADDLDQTRDDDPLDPTLPTDPPDTRWVFVSLTEPDESVPRAFSIPIRPEESVPLSREVMPDLLVSRKAFAELRMLSDGTLKFSADGSETLGNSGSVQLSSGALISYALTDSPLQGLALGGRRSKQFTHLGAHAITSTTTTATEFIKTYSSPTPNQQQQIQRMIQSQCSVLQDMRLAGVVVGQVREVKRPDLSGDTHLAGDPRHNVAGELEIVWPHQFSVVAPKLHQAGFNVGDLSMLRSVAEALDTLHRAGYRHGDVKPDNIMVQKRRQMVAQYVLVDWETMIHKDAVAAGGHSGLGTSQFIPPNECWPLTDPDIQARDRYGFLAICWRITRAKDPDLSFKDWAWTATHENEGLSILDQAIASRIEAVQLKKDPHDEWFSETLQLLAEAQDEDNTRRNQVEVPAGPEIQRVRRWRDEVSRFPSTEARVQEFLDLRSRWVKKWQLAASMAGVLAVALLAVFLLGQVFQ